MSGDVRTGRSDLGDVESRIRRILNLEGLVPTDWNGMIQPVMLVGDGTLPGYGGARLRRFTQSFQTAAAGVDRWITVDSDVIVDRITFTPNAAGASSIAITYQGPNDASPGAIAGRTAAMIDRAQTSQELAPMRDATLGVAGGSSVFTTGSSTLAIGLVHEISLYSFLLCGPNVPGADGARLRFVSSALGQWQLQCRTF